MQQREQTDQRLVWVHTGISCPSFEQFALLGSGERSAAESFVLFAFQTGGRVDQEDVPAAAEPEELP